MPTHPLPLPATDPTAIFDAFRGNYATELLTAAVSHLRLFDLLAQAPLPPSELQSRLELASRPMLVLTTVLRAMGLLAVDAQGRLELTALAHEHLVTGGAFDIRDYIGLAASSPGVRAIVERLRTNRPAGADPDGPGAAFLFREGVESPMEQERSARELTLSLAGRARNVAPVLAERVPLPGAQVVLDAGGGSGIYSIALLRRHPGLRAIVWDRPEVLKVALEMGEELGVADRMECRPGDMFTDPVPAEADVVLLSNVLHDWDVPECRALIRRCAAALPAGGRLLIHDVFLNDALDGPLPVALYSAALFTMTEGRAYSAAEYGAWLAAEGLTPGTVIPTLVHCGVLPGVKPG